ncbi:MAG: class I SAM-dependent methyltransferase [Deinococcota bacterium]
MTIATDQTHLLSKQYHNADNLHARVNLHKRFSASQFDFWGWMFDQLVTLTSDNTEPSADTEPRRILELGCGSGLIWRANRERIPTNWQITLSDFSTGMLAESQQALGDIENITKFKVIDAQDIPYEAATFDLIIANFMLYHVPDLDKAVHEIRRILKPGGQLIAATNGDKHMLELEQLADSWLSELDVSKAFSPAVTLSFRLETGHDILKQQFDNVNLQPIPASRLEVTEAQPILDYALSMNRFRSDTLEADVLANIIKYAEQDLEQRLSTGPIIINKASGLFIVS